MAQGDDEDPQARARHLRTRAEEARAAAASERMAYRRKQRLAYAEQLDALAARYEADHARALRGEGGQAAAARGHEG